MAILRIQILEGEGAVHTPGARVSRPLTVVVTDETGKPVAGAAVSFHLPEDGPGGTFVNGLRTDVAMTDAQGKAAVHAFQANRLPGRFQIRVVASKEQARAGTVSFQYIGEAKPGSGSVAVRAASQVQRHSRWTIIAAAAGGGVLAAVLAAHGSGGSPASPSTPVSPATPAAPTVTIGTPGISVGKP